jgi:RNA polymerase-binding transcription factor DksA
MSGSLGVEATSPAAPLRCKEVPVTELKIVDPAGEYHGQAGYDVDAFRADLEQHRQFRIEQLNELTADISAGSDGALDEVTSALITAAATALADIDAALHRIEDGCFGLCKGCNGAIALDRLKALPMANLCMFCQYAKEAGGPRHEQSPWRPSGLRTVPARPAQNLPPQPTHREPQPPDIVDVWGYGSFPASDPPANW